MDTVAIISELTGIFVLNFQNFQMPTLENLFKMKKMDTMCHQ